jgi:short-subunit dehydrogenase
VTHRTILNKRILLTGASSGIGNQLARQLYARGGRLLVTARRDDRLASLAAELRRTEAPPVASIDYVSGDICNPKHRQTLLRSVATEWGQLDVLINNAGAGAIGPFADADPQRLRTLMEVDFFAAVELTRECLPLLQSANDPAILNVGSVLALRAVPNKSEYCAAKFAVRGWSESIRCELKENGIEVLMVNPSTTRSEFFDALIDTESNTESKSVGSMSDTAVATRIVQALERRKREVILSLGGKFLVYLGRWFPKLTDWLVSR